MGLMQIGWEGVKWINLAGCEDKWQAVGNTAVHL